jgi:DNA-binding response OmpR family regulator
MADSRILLVSDAADGGLGRALENEGYAVSVESDCERAYRQFVSAPADLVIIDVADGNDALDLLQRVRAGSKFKKVLIMAVAEWGSGQPTVLLSQGADAFEPKPINPARLLTAVERLLRPRMAMTAKASGEPAE